MRVVLAIPFRSDDQTRKDALETMLDTIFTREYPSFYEWRISQGGTGNGDFNRGRARNNAVKWAMSLSADVVVILDADSYPEPELLSEAIGQAYADRMIHFPFNRVLSYDRWGFPNESGPSAGGCFVTRPDVWAQTGWMDERLGWSLDDRSFNAQMRAFQTGPVHHVGTLICLWHERGPETHLQPGTDAILAEYFNLVDDPEGMRAYVEARNAKRAGH